ncbi:MAG: class I SAM-dependent methyltransferase [Candidatus Thermoplasmatota archaeon]|nr:class I SAM-dependent methyltransferase [Candidatus Thermoplasmatota archaeon]
MSDKRSLRGKGLYPPGFAWALLLPFRDLYISPGKLAKRLGLREDSIVLEIGCGPGYFSPHIARRIPKGKLYLTDVQPEMIEKARKRLKHIENVDVRVCSGSELPYEDDMFDVIYLVTVLGEIDKKHLYVREMKRILRPGGIVSISEQRGDPDSMALEDVKLLFEPEGFSLKEFFGKGRTYTANFTVLT